MYLIYSIIIFLVIDFCLMKQLKNEIKSNYSMLIMTWASKSNCNQRSGRVGRVADGRVYRLVSKKMFDVNIVLDFTVLILLSKIINYFCRNILIKKNFQK